MSIAFACRYYTIFGPHKILAFQLVLRRSSVSIQHCFIIHIIRSIIFFSTYSSVKPTHSSIYLASRKNEKCQATFKIKSSSGTVYISKAATHMELDHFNYCYLSTNILNVDERLLSHNPISIIIFGRLTYVSIL